MRRMGMRTSGMGGVGARGCLPFGRQGSPDGRPGASGQREPGEERGAARTGRLDVEGAAVRLEQGPGDGQPEPRAAAGALDEALEDALTEAPRRLGLEQDAPDAERLRAYARLGYLHTLEAELDEERHATYRVWADDPEIAEFARAATRHAAQHGVFED